jgi:hypothetical protein
MTMPASIVFWLIVFPAVLLSWLTGAGSRRRGNSLPFSILCALVFPVTWIAWFIKDNRAAGRSAFMGHWLPDLQGISANAADRTSLSARSCCRQGLNVTESISALMSCVIGAASGPA